MDKKGMTVTCFEKLDAEILQLTKPRKKIMDGRDNKASAKMYKKGENKREREKIEMQEQTLIYEGGK